MNQDLYISTTEFLMGRDKDYPLTDELIGNMNTIVPRVNTLLESFYNDNPDVPRRDVSSGYRPEAINTTVAGAAKKSKHMICAAIDLKDHDKLLGQWCLKNLKILADVGLWMESLTTTHYGPGLWTHLQCIPPKSGNRVFLP